VNADDVAEIIRTRISRSSTRPWTFRRWTSSTRSAPCEISDSSTQRRQDHDGGILTTRVVPTSGSAYISGIDVKRTRTGEATLRHRLQQNTLDRQLTVWENLYFHDGSLHQREALDEGRTNCSSAFRSRSGRRRRFTLSREAWPSV